MQKEYLDIASVRDHVRTRKYLKLARQDKSQVCIWGAGKIGTTLGKEMLDYLNIRVDYYCDKNQELVGTESVEGILCEDKERLFREKENTVCFIMIGYSAIESACDYLIRQGVRNIVTYDDLCELPEILSYFLPTIKRDRIAVYTCITGDYDDPREPEYVSEICDYYLVSDTPPEKGSVYQWIELSEAVPDNIKNPIDQNRYCKMHPHLLFPEYKYSIYLDAVVRITANVEKFVTQLKAARIGVIGTTFSGNYYAQALRLIKMGCDTRETFLRQISDYQAQGMPAEVSSYFCTILLREHNHPVCVKLMEEWWQEFVRYSNRDQMSFPYVLWKNHFTRKDLLLICDEFGLGRWHDNPYWRLESRVHKKEGFYAVKEYVRGRIE